MLWQGKVPARPLVQAVGTSIFGMMMRGSGLPLASTTMKPCAMKLLRKASATPEMSVGLVSAFWMAKWSSAE